MVTEPHELRPGALLRDRYRVVSTLGFGGFGVVYKAIQLATGQPVAVKVMRATADEPTDRRDSRVARFRREMMLCARLQHPNIIGLVDSGQTDDGRLFVVFQFAAGRSLAQVLLDEGPMRPREARHLMMQVLDALSCAHNMRVVHRDLKPANIMVTSTGTRRNALVLDFGISAIISAITPDLYDQGLTKLTAQHEWVGTPYYAAPEHIRGAPPTAQSDLYSWGLVYLECLTGQPVIDGSPIVALMLHTSPDPVPIPAMLNNHRLGAILRQAVIKDVTERTATAAGLLAELENCDVSDLAEHIAETPKRRPPPMTGTLTAPTVSDGEGGLHADLLAALRGSAPARVLPSGTVTLLLTGMVDTTQLIEELEDRYAGVVARCDELLRTAVAHHGGTVVEATNAGFLFVFIDAPAALRAAIEAQQALAAEPWPHPAAGRVRMGLHTGAPRRAGERYVGLDMHCAACITAAAAAGQLLASAATRAALDDADLAGLEVRDLGPRRLADLRYPEHLFAIGRPGSTAVRASIHTITALRHNLPPQPTTFVGREAQIAEVRRLLLRADIRVLTLTGPGGTGKTRLSLEVARAALDELAGGVFQVQLAPVTDPALVMAAIAQALDAPLSAGRTALATVKARIAGEPMVLVLDNFEQVIDATQALADLLAACPALKLLVTSRQPLKLRGEREHVVPPMQVPAGDRALADCESVRLFVERVRDTRADFALTADNAPIVAAICARLDGLPLAIELAASRMKMLTLTALRDRLGDRLGLLKGGPRDAATRHQTLRAAIDWSHNMLDEPDKILFRRAAVFVGGFAIESAEEVCAFPADAALDVFGGLASLTDKSLFTREEVDGESRLGMLEMIREYALEQLGRTGDLAAARARHGAHFAALAETMAPGLMGHDQRRCVGRMLTEADNLRAALGWALAQPTAATTARLLRAMLWLWVPQGQFNEARTWARRAVEQARRHDDARSLAEVLDVAAWLGFLAGDQAGAVPLGAESVALFEALGDEAAAARAKVALGAASLATAPIAECERLLDEALVVSRRHGDGLSAAMALNALGEMARVRDDGPRARACYAEAIALLQQSDNLFLSSLITTNLVYFYLRDGDWRTAAELLGKMLTLGRELNYPTLVYVALAATGGVAVARGQAPDGVRLIAVAERMLTSIGHAPEPPDLAEWDRYRAAARAAVGDEVVAAVMAEDVGWTLEQAIAATLPLLS